MVYILQKFSLLSDNNVDVELILVYCFYLGQKRLLLVMIEDRLLRVDHFFLPSLDCHRNNGRSELQTQTKPLFLQHKQASPPISIWTTVVCACHCFFDVWPVMVQFPTKGVYALFMQL